jgi:hypothetical protein
LRKREHKTPHPVEYIDGVKVMIRGGKLFCRKGTEWAEIDRADPAHKWVVAAWYNSPWVTEDGRYTAVGAHIKGNPYGLDEDFLERDGRIRIFDKLDTEDDVREYFHAHPVYGIVFFAPDGKVDRVVCRTQYGCKWPVKESEDDR